jgi:hypothetical protein
MNGLEKEIKTYNNKIQELLNHIGKYVVIKDDSIIGYFDAYGDALRAGYEKFGKERFLVKLIAPSEKVFNFSRDLVPECRL